MNRDSDNGKRFDVNLPPSISRAKGVLRKLSSTLLEIAQF